MPNDKTIDPSVPIVDLESKPLKKQDGEALTVGYAIALCLVGGTASKDPLMAWVLARKFTESKEPVELNAAEMFAVREAVKANGSGYTALVTGQILEALS